MKGPIMAKKYYSSNSKGNRSNLPQEVKIQDYPEYPCGGKMGYEDDLAAVDRQIKSDNKGNNNSSAPGHWN